MIERYRAAYFLHLDTVCQATGNSKKYLHEYFKAQMFPFLHENPLNFVDTSRKDNIPDSTTLLSEEGWKTFYTEFRHFAADKFKI